ncbi:hypothetical protein TanjilG_22545 [Lupinus angustifolius]|uniref:CP12 domain-containing protein n=1 Tax=Lupinus angustifolius TaxID=3871 RepID=A0A4P1RSY9_LUPAN|nr:PREDICTED: calvin cycle protein CP12-2, chloroplastic-like [Lupinus angustifolius]OIW17433.1 hypothetical protein TanjilG_22545 [Lupinus angustifolius]
MATMAFGTTLSLPKVLFKSSESPQNVQLIKLPRLLSMRPATTIVYAAPERISQKVEESIKNAKETCSDDPTSGECVAAWDEVEELSAAASHARDRSKELSDPLENYCKDNPETIECKTYDN